MTLVIAIWDILNSNNYIVVRLRTWKKNEIDDLSTSRCFIIATVSLKVFIEIVNSGIDSFEFDIKSKFLSKCVEAIKRLILKLSNNT